MSEQNKEIVRRFYDEIFNKKNTAAIDEICSSDFVDGNPMLGQVVRATHDGDEMRVLMEIGVRPPI